MPPEVLLMIVPPPYRTIDDTPNPPVNEFFRQVISSYKLIHQFCHIQHWQMTNYMGQAHAGSVSLLIYMNRVVASVTTWSDERNYSQHYYDIRFRRHQH